MKTRTGFVSNSSSSSFIIAVGKVKNIDKFKEAIGESWEFEFKQVKDISGDKCVVESFDYDDVSLDVSELDPEDWVFEYYRCEGDDSDFTIYDEDGEFVDYDYNIDLDDFSQKAHDQLALIDQHATNVQMSYGAGRNG